MEILDMHNAIPRRLHYVHLDTYSTLLLIFAHSSTFYLNEYSIG